MTMDSVGYIERAAEKTVEALLKQFKVVMVTGSRQVGKTTMLKHCLPSRYSYVTLDDMAERMQASDDPLLFFKNHPLPVILDEVQQSAQLFPVIKAIVDQQSEYGKIVLTGSQTFQLMKGVSESLAGRIAVLQLPGLSLRERTHSTRTGMYLPGAVKAGDVVQGAGGSDLWDIIWRGSMPRLADDSVDWDYYYSNYFRTYIERDVRELVNVRDEEKFSRFVVACAARTGELVNYSDLAADCSIDTKTARHWISVLQASGIVKLLLPFFSNASKRLSKTPKLYFMDTGLACHLLGWTSPLTLRNGAASGQMFETFVVGEILKSYFNDGRTADNVFFYRDSKKREIDVLIRDGRTLRPVEIKQNVRPGREAIKNFSALESISGFDIGQGAVICQTDATYWIGENVMAESVWMI